MFWRANQLSTSEVDTYLEKENISLKELLELEDIIQECKNQNKKLVEYLVSGNVLSDLIDLIIHEPPEDLEPTRRFKLANVAAELLSCEVPQVNEKISCEEILLDKLYSFLETSQAPLNPLLASFFSKAFGVLITRKSEQNWYSYQFTCLQVFEFLKKKEFVGHILKHIGTSAISDLVIRLITCVEGTSTKQGLLDWLNEKQLIESIIGLLNDSHDRDVHDNASRLLIEILRVARDGQYAPSNERCADPLLATLESPATIELLLNTMFSRPAASEAKADDAEPAEDEVTSDRFVPSESVLVNGICILLALLENRKAVNLKSNGSTLGNGSAAMSNVYTSAATYGAGEASSEASLTPEEAAQQQALLDATIASILPRLSDFTELLMDPPNKTPVQTTAGLLDPPLGQARLHIAKLVSILLATNNSNANRRIIELKTLDKLLDLFFQYSLNNFLHAQVECCIKYAFCCALPPPPSTTTPVPATTPTATTPNASADEAEASDASAEAKSEDAIEASNADAEIKETDSEEKKVEEASTETGEKVEAMEEGEPAVAAADAATSAAESTETADPAEKKEEDAANTNNLNPLLIHLFTDCRLVERILSAWEDNESAEAEPGFRRKGYMGHLTRIANVMANMDSQTSSEAIAACLSRLMTDLDESTRDKWSSFVGGKLAETNERNTIVPPNSYASNNMSSSEDDDADFRDIHFSQDSSLQQAFAEYQMQQMSDNIHDPYGFTEDDFNDNEEAGKNFLSSNRVLRFGLDDSGSSPSSKQATTQQDFFDSYFKSKSCFPGDFDGDEKTKDEDDEEDDDPWENKTCELTFGGSASGPGLENSAASSSGSLSPIKLSPGKTSGKIVDASSPSTSDHLACSSSSDEDDEEATKADRPAAAVPAATAMDVEEAGDDFWEEDVPPGIIPIDMDTGNPWDATSEKSASEASTTTAPVIETSGEVAPFATDDAFGSALTAADETCTKPETAWAAFGEMDTSTAATVEAPATSMETKLEPETLAAPEISTEPTTDTTSMNSQSDS